MSQQQVILKILKGEPTKDKMINLKLSITEYELLRARAYRYAGGNISAWIRYAAINLEPNPKDLTSK